MPTIQIKAIIPKNTDLIDTSILMREMKQTLEARNKKVKRDFEGTVRGWSIENKPTFRTRTIVNTSEMLTRVWAKKKVYSIVNAGAKKHTITARRGGALQFQTGYRSATRPGSIKSQGKRRSGNWVSAKSVNHPGFKGRKFDEQIAELHEKPFQDDVDKVFDRVARLSRS